MTKKIEFENFEFRTDTVIDALILLDALKKIKAKKSFMICNKKRYFKITA